MRCAVEVLLGRLGCSVGLGGCRRRRDAGGGRRRLRAAGARRAAAGRDARGRARDGARRRPGPRDAPARHRHRRRALCRVHRGGVPGLGGAPRRAGLCRPGEHSRRRGRRRRDGARVHGDGRHPGRTARRGARGGPGRGRRQARAAIGGVDRRTGRRPRRVTRGHRSHLRSPGRGSPGADRRAAAAHRNLGRLGRATARQRTLRARATRQAAEILRAATAGKDAPMLLYNLACYESLAGRSEDAMAHLRRAIELDGSYRALAAEDPDFDPIRAELTELRTQSCSSRKQARPESGSGGTGISRKPRPLVRGPEPSPFRNGVEPHVCVAEPAGFGDDRLGEAAAEPGAARRRSHVEPLHLAGRVVDRPQAHAALAACEQQCAARWCVRAGQIGQLAVEVLEVEREGQRRRVFAEERANLVHVGHVPYHH